MKNGFEKVEYGLKLLKEDSEKIDKNVDFADKFFKYRQKEKYTYFKMKYVFTYVFVLLLTLNLFLTTEKLKLEKTKKSYSYIVNIPNKKDNLPEIVNITLNKNQKSIKKENKIVKFENMKDEKVSPIDESIKFTEEINKIVGLFIINLNIGGEDVEI